MIKKLLNEKNALNEEYSSHRTRLQEMMKLTETQWRVAAISKIQDKFN
jgi:hypothetical protein